MTTYIAGALVVVGLPLIFLFFRRQFIAACLFLLGTIILVDSLWTMRQEKALAATGVKAMAESTGGSYTEITKLKSGSKRYKADISFTTASCDVVAENAEITAATLEQFKIGKPVRVTYLPSNPRYYRFDPWAPVAGQDIVFGLILMAIGGAWVAVKRRRAKNEESDA